MDDEFILNKLGFEKCEWNPGPDDQCEKCKKQFIQMYYHRTDYWVDEGTYWCIDCIRELYNQIIIDFEYVDLNGV